MSAAIRHKAELTGVSETALLTLNARAREARRADAIIDDPMAIRLVDSIDADFGKFGSARQEMALRARAFDLITKRYLASHPDAGVVALAEGLQTSFWRLDDSLHASRFRWLTVDLPPIIELRRRLLPENPRVALCAQSALDYSWMDRVETEHGVFITAEGLLMYLQPEQALGLIAECASRFPGGQMLFDLPPTWFTAVARLGLLRPSLRYTVPAMPFSRSTDQLADLADTIPGIRAVRDLQMPPGRGWVFNTLLSTAYQVRVLDRLRPTLTLLEFG
ncbi:class I SAM-dependent methyltransferase [Mycolicibacterium komossense]|uniref:Class I SAM-dependent methyltransferase n=1 Tax=Mycolicibacterium komossense TaxID=1779 RepID=A0ABT3C4U0_9MYCO|nr:class I SAM-dependent methyltransferase [Mycolicibacterium komossense]MCV7224470.1 class I SAM-dependent methyltransferase [Mycolicibacterium komossense]